MNRSRSDLRIWTEWFFSFPSILCQVWQALHFSILSSLHFFILASRSVTPSMVTSPLSPLLGLEIVSLALGLITVLSRSVSLSFRGVDSLIRFLKDLMHTCLHDLCAFKSLKPRGCALIRLLNAGYSPLKV